MMQSKLHTVFSITYDPLALVWIEQVEDVVRFELSLLREFGRPEEYRIQEVHDAGLYQTMTDGTAKAFPRIVMRRLIDQLERRVGRFPVST